MIYEACTDELIDIIASTEDKITHLFMVGHNPGFTSLANMLGSCSIDNVPTCGIVSIEFKINSWGDISRHNGEMQYFDFPKRHR